MINLGQILGRVGKIETKNLPSGTGVTNMSLVTSKKFTKDGEKHEKVTWHNVTCFSKLSEIAQKYVAIGDLLYVSGEMDNQKYTGKDGIERSKSYLLASEIKLMPKNKEHKPEPKKEVNSDFGFEDSEIPF